MTPSVMLQSAAMNPLLYVGLSAAFEAQRRMLFFYHEERGSLLVCLLETGGF